MKILLYEFKRLLNFRYLVFAGLLLLVLLSYFYRGVSLHENLAAESGMQNISEGTYTNEIKLFPPLLAGFFNPEQYSAILKLQISDDFHTQIVQNVTGRTFNLLDNFFVFLLIFLGSSYYTGVNFISGSYTKQTGTLKSYEILKRLLLRFLYQNIFVIIMITVCMYCVISLKQIPFKSVEISFIFDFFLILSALNLMFFLLGAYIAQSFEENRHKNILINSFAAILILVAPVVSNFMVPHCIIDSTRVNSEREIYLNSSDKDGAILKINKINRDFYNSVEKSIKSYESSILYSPVSYLLHFIDNGTGKGTRGKLNFIKYCNKLNIDRFLTIKKGEKWLLSEHGGNFWQADIQKPEGYFGVIIAYYGVTLILVLIIFLKIRTDSRPISKDLDSEAVDNSVKYLMGEGGAFGFLKAESPEVIKIARYISDKYAYLRWPGISKNNWPGNMAVFEILGFLNLKFDKERAMELALRNNFYFESEDKDKHTYSAKLVMASKEKLNLKVEDFSRSISNLDDEKFIKIIGCCFMASDNANIIFEDVFLNIKERNITFFKDFFKKVAEQEGKYILYIGSEYFPVFDPLQFSENNNNLYPVHKETKSFTRH